MKLLKSFKLHRTIDLSFQDSRYAVRPRCVEFRLAKKSPGWWERLLKDKSRQHWLRVDFQNWKDEDDAGDEKESFEEVDMQFDLILK